jgi:transcriptional regulator GlxA family with amidase domain
MTQKTIAFLVFPDLTPLDFIGPLTVLKMLEGQGYSAVTVAGGREPMMTDLGFQIVPERTFEEVPEPFALVVPGGALGPIKAMVDDRLMGWVRAAAEKATVVGSVCTGSLILGAAGLLEGRQATTHWAFLGTLEKMGARPTKRRWVEDGKLITAAGVSAGIDMALALAARLTSEGVARNIQHIIEYYPEPPFGSDPSKADLAEIGRQLAGMSAAIPQILAGKPELARFF